MRLEFSFKAALMMAAAVATTQVERVQSWLEDQLKAEAMPEEPPLEIAISTHIIDRTEPVLRPGGRLFAATPPAPPARVVPRTVAQATIPDDVERLFQSLGSDSDAFGGALGAPGDDVFDLALLNDLESSAGGEAFPLVDMSDLLDLSADPAAIPDIGVSSGLSGITPGAGTPGGGSRPIGGGGGPVPGGNGGGRPPDPPLPPEQPPMDPPPPPGPPVITPVPLPAALWLFPGGLAAFALWRRREQAR